MQQWAHVLGINRSYHVAYNPEASSLIQQWMAIQINCMVYVKDNSKKEEEEGGIKYFSYLLDLSM